MKIDFYGTPGIETFSDIVVGECFYHEKSNYIKVKPLNNELGNAVRLATGETSRFVASQEVSSINLKVVKG